MVLGDSLRRRRGGPRRPDPEEPEGDGWEEDTLDWAASGGAGPGGSGSEGAGRKDAGSGQSATGLGSSLRRSGAGPGRGRGGAGPWRDWLDRGAEAGRRAVQWAGGSGGPWLIAAVVVLIGSFTVGYLISTQILFPRPETAGTGIAVPSLYGESRSEAESAIRTAGLAVGEVTELANRDVERGRVVAQAPVPGQQLRSGGAVSFAVSAGAPVLRVPPVRGLGGEAARELLEAVGFEVDVETLTGAGVPAGTVARADPPAGTQRELPSRVTLYVAEAPDTADPGSPPMGEAPPVGSGRPAPDSAAGPSDRVPSPADGGGRR